jgi:hypothetical protein
MTELSLWLDDFDDLFSDFDSRLYRKRRVSEDFLYEMRNELKYRKEKMNILALYLPQDKRQPAYEKDIADNLRDFFSSQYLYHTSKCRRKLRTGILFALAGVLLMILNSFLSYKDYDSFTVISLRVITEPAGWFLLWTAFDNLFYDLREMKKEKNLYRQLSGMNIEFRTF